MRFDTPTTRSCPTAKTPISEAAGMTAAARCGVLGENVARAYRLM